MRKALSILAVALIAGCSSTTDDLARYEDICINKMGICPADGKRMDKCVNELRKLEDENSKVEYITEYKTEYQCCNAPETRTERRVEYKNREKQQRYEAMEYQRYQADSVKTASSASIAPEKVSGCVNTVVNGISVQRCTCGGREPVICREQMVNNQRIRRCEAEAIFLRR
ncbi:MAG: hypothetical protein LBR70_03745 [Lactobacillaceae bacterium]|nr:hypothetical protein [Lactobacillaceae bacterium]